MECLNLVKKNFVIMKNYYIILMISNIIIPIVVSQSAAVMYFGGGLPLLIQASFTLYFAFNQLTFLESKYQSFIFLSTTPYDRKKQVNAMYATIFLLYFGILVTYVILSTIPISGVPPMTINNVLIVTSIIAIIYSIFIPAFYLLDYDKAKYIPVITTFIIPYAAVLISKISFITNNLSSFKWLIAYYGNFILSIITILFLGVSIKLAQKWYDNKEF